MKLTAAVAGKKYQVDNQGIDISTPVQFDGSVKAFGASSARKEMFRAGSFKGDVRAGGSCNCELYTFSPHLHGTHTECVGHISKNRIAVTDIIKDTLVPATLITLKPEKAAGSYDPPLHKSDRTITATALEKALGHADRDFLTALVIRTNSRDLKNPSFFSHEAMKFIASLPVLHLLTDLPSVDRRDDGGKLSNHRIFWGVKPGVTAIKSPSPRTITELINAPSSVKDGRYILDLQVAPFVCDAAPSRPVLYKVKP